MYDRDRVRTSSDGDAEEYSLKGRKFHFGLGVLKWYFFEFRCDSSHQTFTVYVLILLAAWAIYIAAFSGGYFFYSMLAGCCLGVLMSIYAVPKIRDILAMRKGLRTLVKANIKYSQQSAAFATDIGSVNKAHSKLDEIQSSINTTNANLKNHYKDFSQYGQRLNQRNVDNIESLKRLKYHFTECQQNYQALLTRAEKTTLNQLYRQIHKQDGKPGLSMAEFKKFVRKLPAHYKRRFHPLEETFRRYAGEDLNMDYKEFQIMIDSMARSEALGL